jgi:hypothetical protein
VRAHAVRLLAAAALAAAPAAARPHEVPREHVMVALVKAEPGRVQLVIRVPLALLGEDGIPPAPQGGRDPASARPDLRRAVAAVGRRVAVSDGERVLAPEPVAARVSPPSDRFFASWDEALEHLRRGPSEPGSPLPGGFLDAQYAYLRPAANGLSVELRDATALREHLVLFVRYLPARGAERTYRLSVFDGPVALDLRWQDAAASFVASGWRHILDGIDHLLFLLCVILPLRRPRALLGVVTSFTVAHSVTLAAAAHGLAPAGAWFPPLVEALVAASIAYMAVENVLVRAPRRRWLVTGAFGLVHGFAFASALSRDLQLAGDHLLLSLLAFNVGVEAGQLAVLAAALPALWVLARAPVVARWGTPAASIVAALVASRWLAERLPALRTALPERGAGAVVVAAATGVACAAAAVALAARLRRRAARRRAREAGAIVP